MTTMMYQAIFVLAFGTIAFSIGLFFRMMFKIVKACDEL